MNFLLVDGPVTKPRRRLVAVRAEPSVVAHEHIDAEARCLIGDADQLVGVEVKIRRLPVVDEDRPLAELPRTPDEMVSVEVMERPRHAAEPCVRVNEHRLRRIKRSSRLQLPLKRLRMNAHDHTDLIKRVLLHFCEEIPGIYKMHGVDLAAVLTAVFR